MNFVMAVNQAEAGERISVLPAWSTFIILVVVVVELMVAGFFLKRKWLEKHEALPIPAALAMMFFMVSLYVLVGSALYWSSPITDRPQILFWLFVLYIPLVIQYGLNVVNAIVWRATMRISPAGVEIPDSPVVSNAQKLLMAGKIDEAVALYTAYFERRTPALAEVARLLKAENKLDEAASIFEDLVNNHASDRVAWPEAVYSLAKIYETQPGKTADAIALYRRLLDEAPDSRFTHLAGADLARLMVMDAGFIRSLHEDDDAKVPEDPFYAQRRNFLLQRMRRQESSNQEDDDGASEGEEEGGAAAKPAAREEKSASVVKKKTPAKKKPAAKKSTARKTAAKKATSPKKTARKKTAVAKAEKTPTTTAKTARKRKKTSAAKDREEKS